ncbi:4Fe-4S dicluster domain-containing protein [Tianweitania sediminis]|uniref:4Fe-4S dicluster domain-containing protein n=2 Tax=Tianweitania sediminis TaxID=1502156 RepID=A0A8J7RJB7_9HYPH|nr:4Fe-4S dicluster domain-containing protein [Tianweitania sediminis]MBP0439511.1 4Fe-4S dicluster domain-containing protein [Tianweitania sediminis]
MIARLSAEFPALAPDATGINRRSLLKAMGASLALAGVAGCTSQADETAMPYVEQPEGETPGIARWYATATSFAGYAQPVFGKTYSGRPVKLEGNARDQATRGAIDPFTQAALLGLYDPHRSQAPRYLGQPGSWTRWERWSVEEAARLDRNGGNGLRFLTGRVTSPTLRRQMANLLQRWPNARWHTHEPFSADEAHDATSAVFGRPLDRHLRPDRADVIVALDDDFLGPGPWQVRHARDWSDKRRAMQQGQGESWMAVAEPLPTLTGVTATQRLIAHHDKVALLVRGLAARLGLVESPPILEGQEAAWLDEVHARLQASRGTSLVLVGHTQPTEVQALGLLINEALGNWGRTISFRTPVAALAPEGNRSLQVLVEEMLQGRVSTLVMLDTDPLATTPAALEFGAALANVEAAVHAGLYADETAALSHWHLPIEHPLESWTDLRAPDGTVTVVQPLVKPFWSVRSQHEILDNLAGHQNTLAGHQNTPARAIVQQSWRADWGVNFEERWAQALLDGFVDDTAEPTVVPAVQSRAAASTAEAAEPAFASGLTLLVRPDPTIWDGRYSEIAWLQELPKPITKITWGNAVLVSPALAADRGLANEDAVEVLVDGRSLRGPVWIVPGQDPATVVIFAGGGRSGGLAEGYGIDPMQLLPANGKTVVSGVELRPTGEQMPVATTQPHHAMHGHDFVRSVKREDLPDLEPMLEEHPSFYPEPDWSSPSWGMAIDLDVCIGCNACVIACQSENNIPVVGKELVAQGREMHWLRVDHYHEGPVQEPDMAFQPVPCMHCEQAPCEMGCPVNAAVHSYDGLNLQVYNRCIGTRTCSSFCPYKVRRFNWFDFTQEDPESLQAMRNPEVTVRQRGVMEKCTYCIQRIANTRIEAQKEGRPIADGEVVTACQAACPTTAITFGNVLDPDTVVSRQKAQARNYALLGELNTRPRTTYLAKISDRAEPAPPSEIKS